MSQSTQNYGAPIFASRPQARQRGFALGGVMVALVVLAMSAIFAAQQMQRAIQDSAAESTGRYLLQLRDAVVDLQVKHEAWLRNEDLPADAPTPPSLTWAAVPGGQVARGTVAQLVNLGVLPSGVPLYPVYGNVARFMLVRQGTCPGENCQTSAYVYTCHPISTQSSLRTGTTCTAPSGARADYSQAALGRVLMSAGGYGGHDAMNGTNVTGALLNVPRAWFDFGDDPGHVVLAAGLGATPFGQFVRHGDTRPVTLNNTLKVAGAITSETGLILDTAVTPGSACTTNGMYASTSDRLLAVCTGGLWFSPDDYTVTGVYGSLPNGASVPALSCPTGMTSWRHVAMQATDVTVTGSDISVAGSVGGTLSGTGSVNAAGSVTISGSFSGTFQNSGSSYVRVSQQASVTSNRVVISPSDLNARATVIQGCRAN